MGSRSNACEALAIMSLSICSQLVSNAGSSRLESSGFIEKLQIYFNSAPLPLLPAGCTAQELYAENAMLFDLDKSGKKGTFSVQCKMKYDIDYTEVNNT